MANFIFNLAREFYCWPDLVTDDIGVLLAANTYVPDQDTDEFLADIAGGAQLALFSPLLSPTFALGIFDAANFSFGVVAGGDTANALVLIQDTGVAGTSRLLCYIDGSGGTYTGLPLVTDGTAITVAWPGAGIFRL